MAVVFVGYREFDRARDVREANAVMDRIAQLPAQLDAERAQADQQAAQRRRVQAQNDVNARALAPDMQCVGGVVVRVSGSTYTQLGTVGDPVRCSGRMVDRPIR